MASLIRQALVPRVQTKACVVATRTLAHVYADKLQAGIVKALQGAYHFSEGASSLGCDTNGNRWGEHAKQRRGLIIELPMHILTIRNTRPDCGWSEDKGRATGQIMRHETPIILQQSGVKIELYQWFKIQCVT